MRLAASEAAKVAGFSDWPRWSWRYWPQSPPPRGPGPASEMPASEGPASTEGPVLAEPPSEPATTVVELSWTGLEEHATSKSPKANQAALRISAPLPPQRCSGRRAAASLLFAVGRAAVVVFVARLVPRHRGVRLALLGSAAAADPLLALLLLSHHPPPLRSPP